MKRDPFLQRVIVQNYKSELITLQAASGGLTTNFFFSCSDTGSQ
jgi:hypothetical protein